MKQRINSKLVDQIRVIALKRVTKNFNAKNNADARTYSYILPTLAFAPSQETADEKYRITSERIQMANDYLKVIRKIEISEEFVLYKRNLFTLNCLDIIKYESILILRNFLTDFETIQKKCRS